jgi:penicillin-binding protein 1A
VVWTGNDDNSQTRRATGGGPPARIFSAFMSAAPRSGLDAQPSSVPLQLVEPSAGEAVAEPEAEAPQEDPIAAFLASLGRD